MTADHDAIRARAEAATPGPWRADSSDGHELDIIESDQHYIAGDVYRSADAIFIHHARTDIPALLDANAALAAEVERQAEDLDESLEALAALQGQRGALIADLTAARDRVADLEEEVERLASTCTCDTGPWSTGPEADCAVHGAIRAYNLSQTRVADLEAELADALDGGPVTATPSAMEQIKTLRAEVAELEAANAELRDDAADIRDQLGAWREAFVSPGATL